MRLIFLLFVILVQSQTFAGENKFNGHGSPGGVADLQNFLGQPPATSNSVGQEFQLKSIISCTHGIDTKSGNSPFQWALEGPLRLQVENPPNDENDFAILPFDQARNGFFLYLPDGYYFVDTKPAHPSIRPSYEGKTASQIKLPTKWRK